ncbi:uncharacterized protein LOC135475548 [Liolophura sinensis]|uniref:uncharacterized protein LOC135475548 n=1 Tax=Liolophura sinensis TaxID=3198878 RepID=UPI0031594987
MPTKKKVTKKSKKSTKAQAPVAPPDPLKPEYIPPPPKPGEQLIKLLTSQPVDEREVYGLKVPSRILAQLTPTEIRDLRSVFELFDSDSDGFVNPPELRRTLRVLGFKISREEARKTISVSAVKQRGCVDFLEFLDIILDKQGDSRDTYNEIKQGFQLFDYENRGKISVENLKQACHEAGIKFTSDELAEMIEEADLNGDGEIDRQEFTRIMLQTNLF